ncbi:Voltage-dependent calcium channel subunit alpha-2/delta-4 [Halocaridina rubra]|uniref:Voltage-dependent calcium channel subunit alpha-2/delta-4 n=1 Tax=Halocaridina rubra TaxID=373956 RepID=A0AAN8WX04_HALRR
MALLFSSGRHNFGITTTFVATRSGLTRWLDLTKPNHTEEHEGLPHFMKIHNKAIDEVWYKRAVDYYDEDPEAYVYSVPFDAATQNPGEVLVTATRAIFIEENNYRKAPAAVVGVTIMHNKFVEYFKNETYKCPAYPSRDSSACRNAKTCESSSLDCYLLDDNGFIIASEKEEDTGKFFGTLEGTIMESLVESKVYKRVRVFDYQAVCLDSDTGPSTASILTTVRVIMLSDVKLISDIRLYNPKHQPIKMLKWSLNWVMGNIFWVMVKTHLYTLWDPNEAWAYTHTERDVQYPVIDEPTPEVMDYKDIGDKPRKERAVADYLSDEVTGPVESEAPDYVAPNFSGDSSADYVSNKEGTGDEGKSGGEKSEEQPPDYEVEDYSEALEGSGSGEGVEDPDEVLSEYIDMLDGIYDDFDGVNPDESHQFIDDYDVESSDSFPRIELAYINKTKPRPCDKEVTLYRLQNKKLIQDGAFKPVKGKLSNCHTNGCHRTFSIQKVKSTNLILVAVNNLCPCESRKVDIEPVEVDYNETMHCNRLLLSHFRRRPVDCFNYHPDEKGRFAKLVASHLTAFRKTLIEKIQLKSFELS